MFTMDMPMDAAVQQYPVMLVANENSEQEKSMEQVDFILEYCQPIPSWGLKSTLGELRIDPVGRLISHLYSFVGGYDLHYLKDRPGCDTGM
jgi:hypothetical protein